MENKELNNPKKRQKKANPEFKYIDEVPKENLQGNRIFVDPEKIIINHDGRLGKFFSYTNRQYLRKLKD
jgi:hypothetical protein